MDSIKRFFTKKNKDKPTCKKRPKISSPIERNCEKLTVENSSVSGYPPRLSSCHRYRGQSHISSATTSFIPRDRAREETITWLNSGTYESLAPLLTERDKAAKQIRRGPRTKGTKEVQLILKNPSRNAVEQLHRLQQQTEMAIRYGAPGVVVYNFSKSLGWNQASTFRLSSLQSKDFETIMKEMSIASAAMPPIPFSPMNWLVLPEPTIAHQSGPRRPLQPLSNYEHADELQQARSSSPISEPGGWRDSEQVDIADLGPELLRDSETEVIRVIGEREGEDHKGEYDPYDNNVVSGPFESQAIAMTVTPVYSQQIRQVSV
ncbi:hypothetical protein F5Y12DRAFT_57472 [Xylaria sp. FL1777]|nr:hypothetical protein F5Y12DRAFT_57472 [Xylaria sp. FL1777]